VRPGGVDQRHRYRDLLGELLRGREILVQQPFDLGTSARISSFAASRMRCQENSVAPSGSAASMTVISFAGSTPAASASVLASYTARQVP
jgi:hypothetical protein